jgi:hypothetical protein
MTPAIQVGVGGETRTARLLDRRAPAAVTGGWQ